jgi:hypothetical protein
MAKPCATRYLPGRSEKGEEDMRIIGCFVLIATVAACGGGGAEENVAAPKASQLTPGQWELTSEVTAFQAADQGEPKIDTPVGTRATETVCVGEGRPPAALFAGEGYRCNFDNHYMRGGRINVTLQCGREDLSGSVPITVSGSFEAESLEITREIRTVLATDGDVQITQRVNGRRIGDCPPESEGGNESEGENANAQDG